MTEALQPGTRIQGHTVQRWLGALPDGHWYRVCDADGGGHATLLEFAPAAWAGRDGQRVLPLPGRGHEFGAGMQGFQLRARQLTQFEHPALPRLLDLWSCNGTAYWLLPDLRGQTLAEFVAERGGHLPLSMTWPWLRTCCEVARLLHALGRIHGAWDPRAVWVHEEGTLLLPSPQVEGGLPCPGAYLALEQTLLVPGNARRGPWTDVFGIAALAGFMHSGEGPLALQRRPMMRPGAGAATGSAGAADAMLAAIRVSLLPNPRERPQDIAQFEAMIGMVSTPRAPLAAPLSSDRSAAAAAPGIDSPLQGAPAVDGETASAPGAAADAASPRAQRMPELPPASQDPATALPPASQDPAASLPPPVLELDGATAAKRKRRRRSSASPAVPAEPAADKRGRSSSARPSAGKPARRAERGPSRRREPAAPQLAVSVDAQPRRDAAEPAAQAADSGAVTLALSALAAVSTGERARHDPILTPGAVSTAVVPIDVEARAPQVPRRAHQVMPVFRAALAVVIVCALAALYIADPPGSVRWAGGPPLAERPPETDRLLNEAPPAAGAGMPAADAALAAANAALAAAAQSADAKVPRVAVHASADGLREADPARRLAAQEPTQRTRGGMPLARCSQALLEHSLGVGSAGERVRRSCR